MKNNFFFFFLICFCLIYSKEEIDSTEVESIKLEQINYLPFFGYIPALGQLENGKPGKALIITGLRTYWLDEYRKTKKTGNISDRNRSLWWLIALLLYGSIDAYIDSEIDDFPEHIVLDSLIQKNK